jgi:signal peptidase
MGQLVEVLREDKGKMKIVKIIYYLFIACLVVVALLLTFSVFPIPGNYKLMVVQSGSMEPAIKLGSIVLIRPAEGYQVGEIITFSHPEAPTQSTTHRIVEIKTINDRQSYVTKGDTNNAPDKGEIAKRDIVGKVLFALPYLGYAVNAVRKPFGFMLFIVLPATMIIYDEIRKIKEEVMKLRQKKNLVILLLISASLLTLGFTRACFSDTEASLGNTFQAGTWGE